MLRATALAPARLTSKNPPQLAWRSFQRVHPATNLSLGTSANYRYRDCDCQASIWFFFQSLITIAFEWTNNWSAHLS